MNEFKLIYGEHVWTEYNARLYVSPFLVVGGNDIPFAHALRKGILQKKDRKGTYTTTSNTIRFLITGEYQSSPIAPINIFVVFGGRDLTHIQLYPPDMNEFAWESGFYFAADTSKVLRTMTEISKIYPPDIFKVMKTITQESINRGLQVCKVLSTQITAKNRFS